MQLDFFRQLTAIFRPSRTPLAAEPAREDPESVLEESARRLLATLNCPALAAKLRVRWNPRMRSTAGTAHAARGLISLNPRLQQFGEAEVDRTLRHELAHLLAHHRAGRRRIAPHGTEWRQACLDLGLTDEKRCHDLPLPRRTVLRRHHYRCPACHFELQRVRPLRRKSACLDCCRRHNRGRYDERFRFTKMPPPVG
jgi:predicted SprT family Zn-dependent metalloprotease